MLLLNRSRGIVHLCTFLKTNETSSPISKFDRFRSSQIVSSISRIACFSHAAEWFRHPKLMHNSFGNQDVLKNPEDAMIQIPNQFPEWVDLMKLLFSRGYLDEVGNPVQNDQMFVKEFNAIRTACLNFGRDRHNLIRYLSKKDLEIIVGHGCPSSDRKVVNSGKRLRALLDMDERNICISCNLRGDCKRAFVKARQDEGGRTVDVMRILLTYGINLVANTRVGNVVYEAVRKLLKEVVEFSIKEIDSDLLSTEDGKGALETQTNCSWTEENQINFKKHGKSCCPKKLKEHNKYHPLKKGDWICKRCNFLNFAKNNSCLQCKERPPKQQLGPGEWQCDSCNYINFRRNMICLRCDYKRPKASNSFSFCELKDQHGICSSYFEGSHGHVENQYFACKQEK